MTYYELETDMDPMWSFSTNFPDSWKFIFDEEELIQPLFEEAKFWETQNLDIAVIIVHTLGSLIMVRNSMFASKAHKRNFIRLMGQGIITMMTRFSSRFQEDMLKQLFEINLKFVVFLLFRLRTDSRSFFTLIIY